MIPLAKNSGKNYIPERGDIIWLIFDPQTGHEQSGKRPALVLTPKEYNGKVGLGIFCPITRKIKGYPFEVAIRGKIEGAILVDQIKSMDWRIRKAEYIMKVDDTILEIVRKKLELLLF